MTSKCSACEKECITKRRPNIRDGERFVTSCDKCHRFLCKDCVNMTTTDIDALNKQLRILSFLCSSCKSCLTDIDSDDQLVYQYETLRVTLAHKDNYIGTLETDLEDLKLGLKQEIDRLSRDNKLKDQHIKRLERNTQTLDDEVFEVEQSYLSTISSQKGELTQMKKDLIEAVKLNSVLSQEINEHVCKIQSLEQKLLDGGLDNVKELEERNKFLSDQISQVEVKNTQLIVELNKYQQKLMSLESDMREMTTERSQMLTTIDTLEQQSEAYMHDIKKRNNKVFQNKQKKEVQGI